MPKRAADLRDQRLVEPQHDLFEQVVLRLKIVIKCHAGDARLFAKFGDGDVVVIFLLDQEQERLLQRFHDHLIEFFVVADESVELVMSGHYKCSPSVNRGKKFFALRAAIGYNKTVITNVSIAL